MLTADFIATAHTVPAIAAASWFTNAQISRLSAVMNKGFDDMEGIIRSGHDMLIAETTRAMQGELAGTEELLRAESAADSGQAGRDHRPARGA